MDAFALLAYLGALAGVVAYVVSLTRWPTAARVPSSSGLSLTAAALAALLYALGDAREGRIVLGLLLIAVLAQAVAALRLRPPREGRRYRAADRAAAPA